MAWTDIPQYIIDDILGFQNMNQVVDNFNYLYVGGAGQGVVDTDWLTNLAVTGAKIDNDTIAIAKMAAGGTVKTGTYTGDGSVSQAIAGVGFTSRFILIVSNRATANTISIKITGMGATSSVLARSGAGDFIYYTNGIIAIGADGFTVDDAGADSDPNSNGVTYYYACWK